MAQPIHFSFELFPPRTPEGAAKLPAIVQKLTGVQPAFFSVTYGAGGSDQQGTYETVVRVVEDTGIEAAPHLTCVGSTREKIAALLAQYRAAGVKRIVALRGDLPPNVADTGAPGELRYASELVAFIRETQGNHFRIEVAAYPEMHPQAASPTADFEAFRRKAEAGNAAQLGAPMPGVVSQVTVAAGQTVKSGDVLLSIEAMKMETALHADRDGTISEVLVRVGDQIDAKDLLIELE